MPKSEFEPNKLAESIYDRLKTLLPEDIYVLEWYILLPGDDDRILIPDKHFAVIFAVEDTIPINIEHLITVPYTDDGVLLAVAALMLVLG